MLFALITRYLRERWEACGGPGCFQRQDFLFQHDSWTSAGLDVQKPAQRRGARWLSMCGNE